MIIDILAIIFLVAFVLNGYKKGFAISLLTTISFVASLILTAIFYNDLARWFAKTALGMSFREKVAASMANLLSNNADTAVSQLALPEVLKKGVSDSLPISEISGILAQNITNAIITILAVIVLFVAIRFLFILFKKPLKLLAKLPIINVIDKFAGAVLGTVAGILWLYIIVGATGIFSFLPVIDKIYAMMGKSNIIAFIYNQNFLLFF